MFLQIKATYQPLATAKLPPVVTTHIPLVGGIVSFLQDPLGTVANAKKRYGNVFTINMFHIRSTFNR